MKVKCEKNIGIDFDYRYSSRGYSRSTLLYLTEGAVYEVYAVSVWEGGQYFLLYDDTLRARWYPATSVKLVDYRICEDWHIKVAANPGEFLQLILGFRKIVEDPDFYNQLTEQEEDALNYFRREILNVVAH